MTNPDPELEAALAERRARQLHRQRLTLETAQGAAIRIGGQACVNFSSNDYLGLAADPEVVAALIEGARRWGVGGGASHLISGHSGAHQALEEALAEFTGRPRALLFSTGYMANMGVINALARDGDLVVQDRLNHASLLDGGFLCRARFERYPHADPAALEALLAGAGSGRRLVVTDGVFSMDGDLAPLAELAALADRHGAWLMVDDAHGFGVLGARGGGAVEALGLGLDQVPILVGTLGKAFGTFGAFVAGSEALIETLIQFARTYIYTTALPPAVAAATLVSLRLAQTQGWRRERLQELIARFRAGARARELPLLPSATPIQPVPVGDSALAVALAARLRAAGYLVGGIRPPTVPPGTARLRIALCAAHEPQQVDGLLDALAAAWRELIPVP
ncbi:MAG: 8-amino-7-oxononanoate synthase [Pseudomonadota bacterium]